jgi:hypothetical protein
MLLRDNRQVGFISSQQFLIYTMQRRHYGLF